MFRYSIALRVIIHCIVTLAFISFLEIFYLWKNVYYSPHTIKPRGLFFNVHTACESKLSHNVYALIAFKKLKKITLLNFYQCYMYTFIHTSGLTREACRAIRLSSCSAWGAVALWSLIPALCKVNSIAVKRF